VSGTEPPTKSPAGAVEGGTGTGEVLRAADDRAMKIYLV
jgi:hypothetical protein